MASGLATISSDRIAQRFAQLRAAGRCAFVPYVTAGHPDPVRSVALLQGLEAAGADVIEVGVPFSDPLADGAVIQASSQRALDQGVRLDQVLEIVVAGRAVDPGRAVQLSEPAHPRRRRRARSAPPTRVRDGVLVTDLPLGADPEREAWFAEQPARLHPPRRADHAARRAWREIARHGQRLRLPDQPARRDGRAGGACRRTCRRRRPACARRRRCRSASASASHGPSRRARSRALADGVVVGSAIVRAADESVDAALDARRRAAPRHRRRLRCGRSSRLRPRRRGARSRPPDRVDGARHRAGSAQPWGILVTLADRRLPARAADPAHQVRRAEPARAARSSRGAARSARPRAALATCVGVAVRRRRVPAPRRSWSAWINAGREVLALISAYGIYAWASVVHGRGRSAAQRRDASGARAVRLRVLPRRAGCCCTSRCSCATSCSTRRSRSSCATRSSRSARAPSAWRSSSSTVDEPQPVGLGSWSAWCSRCAGLLLKRILEESIAAEELNKILAMEQVVSSDVDISDAFRRIQELAHRLVDWQEFRIGRLEDGELHARVAGRRGLPRPAARARRAARTLRTEALRDGRDHPRVATRCATRACSRAARWREAWS